MVQWIPVLGMDLQFIALDKQAAGCRGVLRMNRALADILLVKYLDK